MYILDYLVQLVSQTRAPRQMLELATRAIAIDLGTRSCRLFVRKRGGQLVLSDSFGVQAESESTEHAERVAREALANVTLTSSDTETTRWLGVPLVSRARSLGALVIERPAREQTFSEQELSRFSTIGSHVVDLLESTSLVDILKGTAVTSDDELHAAPRAEQEEVVVGMAAAPGIAIGVVRFRHAFPSELVRGERPRGDASGEHARLRDALQKTENDLLRMQSSAASELGEEQALIFGAHLLLLRDPILLEGIARGIERGLAAAAASHDAFVEIGRRLRAIDDPYLQERSEDLEDLRSRVLGHLIEVKDAVARPGHVVVSPRMSPSIVMELKALGASAVTSEHGGTTSHGALLARALGVPAVTGVADLLSRVRADDVLIVDGDQGRVILRPSAETLRDYTTRAEAESRRRAEFSRYRNAPSRTLDGIPFKLSANVALGADLEVARTNGAEGVGLYRTEFAFIAREGVPSRDEQIRIYEKAYTAFPDQPISFRILDLAGDKFMAWGGPRVARNAFHGYRSIRVLFDYPHIVRDQVQALALAARGRPLRILVPMVSSLEELLRFKQLTLSALERLPSEARGSPPSFGAMIEVPAAVEIVEDLAREVDFFSIGTNDLIQYALVVDREDPRLSSPHHAFHPALWRMLRRVIGAAHAAGKEVGVCGEMAAYPEAAIALFALGIDALSVTPRAIPELKQKLSQIELGPLRLDLDSLLGTQTTEGIEQHLRAYLLDRSSAEAFTAPNRDEQPGS